jgi:arabinose-5-phosphate isomerase
MDYLEKARRVLELEAGEIRRLSERLDGGFAEAVERLRLCVQRRGKVVVCGVGKSGAIGEKIAATLTSTGCPSVVLHAVNALHGDLGVIAEGDVLLVLSYSGETEELLAVLPAVARLGVEIVAVTGNVRSTLAQASALVLDVNVEREACPLELAPTASTTVMLALGDALAMVLLEARGFTREDFARFHPAGQLGRTLLLRVRDIMRDASQMALVTPRTSVRAVLHAMTRKRAGVAVAVEEDGRLAGIFTHGDFARHFQDHPGIGEEPVERFLTRSPVAIGTESLAAEVMHLLERHRIDEVLVLGAAGEPVGVVDSQDLARWRLS